MGWGIHPHRARSAHGRSVPVPAPPAQTNSRHLEGEQGMGASAREIERQIKETRERMDENLTVLEQRAASNAVRVGKIVAVAAGVAAAVVGGSFLYRRGGRPTLKDRLERIALGSLREVASRATVPLPTVK